MAGLPKTRAEIDAILGEYARELNRRIRLNAALAGELGAYNDAALTTAGFSAGEITAIRAASTAFTELSNLYLGAATLTTAKDFKALMRPLYGVVGDY